MKHTVGQFISFVWKDTAWIQKDKHKKLARVVKDSSFFSGMGFDILGMHQMWDYDYVIQHAKITKPTKKELLRAQVETYY